ncbi:MAG: hypothetical protein QOI84_1849, partial [Solirubrobacterales bacterium]|nr:hypothetical protein [Solirubrobacterales bacterium]
VTGGEMDPLSGAGSLTLAGGLKFKAGKKSTTVKGLVLSTAKKSLTAKVGGKKMKLASVAGYTFTRNGFGTNVSIKKLKVTGAAAKQLNKKLGYTTKPKPFTGNKLIGAAKGEEQPSTVTILPGGNVNFTADLGLLKKLNEVEVKVQNIGSTTGTAPLWAFPISGGSIAPTATAGVVQTSGGLLQVQKLSLNPPTNTKFLETEITLGNFYVDLSAKTISVEVVAKSNASPALNLGALGRSSIADLSLTGATVATDPATRTVSVTNASATVQPVAAEVLEGFVKVFQAYQEGGFKAAACPPVGVCASQPEQEAVNAAAKAFGEGKVKNAHIKAGQALGTFSFTAQTQ